MLQQECKNGKYRTFVQKNINLSLSFSRVITFIGANNFLTPEMVEKSESAFPGAGAVVVGLEVSHDAIVK
jgi:hypothetical protein